MLKYLETEQHVSPYSVGHQKNMGGNQNFLELNERESTTCQNLCDTAKAVLRRRFVAIYYIYIYKKHRMISKK
jgi:hypothetical protein